MSWRHRVDAIIRDTEDALYGTPSRPSTATLPSTTAAAPPFESTWQAQRGPVKPRLPPKYAFNAPPAHNEQDALAFEIQVRIDTLRKDVIALQHSLEPLAGQRQLVQSSVAATKDAISVVAGKLKELEGASKDVTFDLAGTTDALADVQSRGNRLHGRVNELEVDLREAVARVKDIDNRAKTAVTADQVARLASESLRSLRSAAVEAAEAEAQRQGKDIDARVSLQLQQLSEQLGSHNEELSSLVSRHRAAIDDKLLGIIPSVDGVRKQMGSMDSDMDAIRHKEEAVSSRIEQQEALLAKAMARVEEWGASFDEQYTSTSAQLKESLEAARQQVQEAKSASQQAHAMKLHYTAAEQQLRNDMMRLEADAAALAAATERVQAAEAAAAGAAARVEAAEAALAARTAAFEEATAAFRRSEAAAQDARKEKETAMEKAQAALAEERRRVAAEDAAAAALRHELQEEEAALRRSRNDVDLMKERYEAHAKDLQARQAACAAERQRVEALEATLRDKERELREREALLESSEHDLAVQARRAAKDAEAAKANAQAAGEELAKAQRTAAELSTRVSALEGSNAALQRELAALKAEHSSCVDLGAHVALQEKNKELEERVQELMQERLTATPSPQATESINTTQLNNAHLQWNKRLSRVLASLKTARDRQVSIEQQLQRRNGEAAVMQGSEPLQAQYDAWGGQLSVIAQQLKAVARDAEGGAAQGTAPLTTLLQRTDGSLADIRQRLLRVVASIQMPGPGLASHDSGDEALWQRSQQQWISRLQSVKSKLQDLQPQDK